MVSLVKIGFFLLYSFFINIEGGTTDFSHDPVQIAISSPTRLGSDTPNMWQTGKSPIPKYAGAEGVRTVCNKRIFMLIRIFIKETKLCI